MSSTRDRVFGRDDSTAVPLQVSENENHTLVDDDHVGGVDRYSNVDLVGARPNHQEVCRQEGEENVSRADLQIGGGRLPTFREAFQEYFFEKKQKLSNAKHIHQWESTMEAYVFPKIGNMSVAEIGPNDIISIIDPIWDEKPETAIRVLGRIRSVLDVSIADGFRTNVNPCDAIRRVLGSENREVCHHPSLPYREIPWLVANLRLSRGASVSKLALEFLILTVTRSSEVRGATFGEIDCKNAIWTIPAERTRHRRTRHVPLSRSCLKIVAQAREITGGVGLLFPGRDGQSQLSDMAFNMLLQRVCRGQKATAEGFRASFESWCLEIDETPRQVRDVALTRRVDRVYTRSERAREILSVDLSELMRRWEAYIGDWKNVRS